MMVVVFIVNSVYFCVLLLGDVNVPYYIHDLNCVQVIYSSQIQTNYLISVNARFLMVIYIVC